ncbi:MAG TPA: sulfite exporter TauE/SafE family protein, partial [Methanoregulaceae archaeon]|nr:sulfite exporter TauE/SafE family protein [Methanoregulaceae archaeon]
LIFLLVLLVVGIKMLVPSLPLMAPLSYGPYYDEESMDVFSINAKNRLYYLHTLTWGAVAGFMSGLTGIGGGIVNVPALVLGGMPIHFAIATSTFVIIFTSISASLAHSKLGNISIPYMAVYSAGAIIGAQVGARIAPGANPKLLRSVVGLVLIFTAIAVLVQSAGGLI